MPGPGDLFAQIQARNSSDDGGGEGGPPKNALLASLQKRQAAATSGGGGGGLPPPPTKPIKTAAPTCPEGKLFHYDESLEAFLFDLSLDKPRFVADAHGNPETDILVPLAPCAYRLADYTLAKKEPVLIQRCLIKLGVLRCLQRECGTLNKLLWHRFSPSLGAPGIPALDDDEEEDGKATPSAGRGSIEEDELGKVRFMELLSNCGVYQKVSEMILQRAGRVSDAVSHQRKDGTDSNPYLIPQVRVDGLDEFMQALEDWSPPLAQARKEIEETQTVSFYPGLGELFTPGSKLVCFPDGMEGVAMGCSCVQSWYAEEINKATNKIKRRFILVVEFMVSVGTELVFVAASEVYPEFHDTSRNVPIKDLTHRKLLPETNAEDADLLKRLQDRGEFYASVATKNHYLEYQPNSFYPIIGGGWSNNAVRPLSKGGRVMIDVKRGILENHLPVRGTADGMSDTVKEAIKLFEQNKRTGIAVPFRTAILPGFDGVPVQEKISFFEEAGDSDRHHLWQAWPCLVGFSFTSRVWGKLLLTLPKTQAITSKTPSSELESPRRASIVKLGVQRAGLGGVGKTGSCGYIHFQEQAFEQLVLDDDKKELIRAVARNAGGGTKFEDGDFEDEEDDEDDMGLDVVANKGAAVSVACAGF